MSGHPDTLVTLIGAQAARRPDAIAVRDANRTVTYAELERSSNQVANLLAGRGLGRGDNVAVSLPNVAEFVISYLGILKVGATVVPLNILLTSREIAFHLEDSQAKAYIAYEGSDALPIGRAAREALTPDLAASENFFIVSTGESAGGEDDAGLDFHSLLKAQSTAFQAPTIDADDTAVILYTSGTTGRPKGAELRHRNLASNAVTMAELVMSGEDDVVLGVLPLFHSFGQTVVQNASLITGARLVLVPRFEPRAAIEALIAEGVTVFSGVPTMYWALLGSATDEEADEISRSLRHAIAGGSALPSEIHREFERRFAVIIEEGYGLSETSPVASFAPPGTRPRVGSIGCPISGVEMKLINDDWSDCPDGEDVVGEIAIRGENVMKGYYRRPEATDAAIRDGWFRSGDLARRDRDGYYYIVDRAKDLIIRGGFNVYPREIEEVLMDHPAVSLVAVTGIPHESLGEEVKAYVLKAEGSKDTEADLVAWAREQMAPYKYPRVVEFVTSMPMTSTGKILKRELKGSTSR